MSVTVNLYSKKSNEIRKFLKSFSGEDVDKELIEWSFEFKNPIELADIIGVFIDNKDDFDINMWICLDKDFLINVNNNNADQIIRYLFERYPY